jgi:hypothetical protein
VLPPCRPRSPRSHRSTDPGGVLGTESLVVMLVAVQHEIGAGSLEQRPQPRDGLIGSVLAARGESGLMPERDDAPVDRCSSCAASHLVLRVADVASTARRRCRPGRRAPVTMDERVPVRSSEVSRRTLAYFRVPFVIARDWVA